jgi:DNA-binding CsgD family transcriptional regulator
MSEIRCKRIAEVLLPACRDLGWDDFVYSFTVGEDWTDAKTNYVREASDRMFNFLCKYKSSKIQHCRHRFSLLHSDLPQTFEVAKFADSGTDRKLAQLMIEYGWQSGIALPHYGFGGALGLTVLVQRGNSVAPEIAERTVIRLAPWQMRMNAWARELIEDWSATNDLSPREIECLLLVGEGMTSRQIADSIGISKRTVEFHIQNGMQKLGGTSRSQAASKLSQLSLKTFGHSACPLGDTTARSGAIARRMQHQS